MQFDDGQTHLAPESWRNRSGQVFKTAMLVARRSYQQGAGHVYDATRPTLCGLHQHTHRMLRSQSGFVSSDLRVRVCDKDLVARWLSKESSEIEKEVKCQTCLVVFDAWQNNFPGKKLDARAHELVIAIVGMPPLWSPTGYLNQDFSVWVSADYRRTKLTDLHDDHLERILGWLTRSARTNYDKRDAVEQWKDALLAELERRKGKAYVESVGVQALAGRPVGAQVTELKKASALTVWDSYNPSRRR